MSNQIDPGTVFVVVPAYNEQRTIQMVVSGLLNEGYKVIVVDDGSITDLHYLLQNKKIFFLHHQVNLGQGAALQTGIEFALEKNARYIITFDADGQHHCKDIQNLLETLQKDNADIVLGSRFLRESKSVPAFRKLVLQLARYVNFIFTGLLLTDAHNGLRAMTNNAAAKIKLEENRMAHASEILLQIRKHKLNYTEAPVSISYTDYSQQKGQTAWSGFRILFDLLLNKIFK